MILWQGISYSKEEFIRLLEIQLTENSIEEWERSIFHFTLEWLDERNELFEVKTSGSTGKPKRIQLTRQQMIGSALATQTFLDLKPGDKALLVLPAQFIAGKMMIVRALEIGMDLYFYPPQVSVLEEVKRPFDFAALIPLQVQYALNKGLVSHLNGLKKMIIGGAALHPKYIAQLQTIETQIYATYGMTETITHVAMRDLKDSQSSYHALPGILFDVDENNCLQIFSDRLPQKNIQTNDVVKLLSEKSFLLMGRSDFIINSGGLKIQIEEVENKISTILDKEFVLVGIQDENLGQALVLVIQGASHSFNEQSLFEEMKNILPKNHLPKKIYYVDQLPRTANHKFDRLAISNMLDET
jgi:O-succinylbenzoic acid--CoA ligase